ncbi:hypothetical protein [Pedobacter alpinus]|uniref:Uncharacterized protein n=1 Tax=Pedobacter alpinus TaxID=1590643 RepID=A0ABW5TT84_9SPHI
MKNILSAILLFLVIETNYCNAQTINYEESLILAQEKSKSLSKILLIRIDSEFSNENLKKEISNPDIIKILNKDFINYRGNSSEIELSRYLRNFNISFFPCLLYFDVKGGLIFIDFGIYNQTNEFLETIKKVNVLNKEKSIIDYDDEYKAGKFDRYFLKNYIKKRMSLGITSNYFLIDKYIDFLEVPELSDYNEVLFILKAGPLAQGKAHRLISVNSKIIDSIYKTEPINVLKEIDETIITNTMNVAVKNKSFAWANAASNYTRLSWGKNYVQADLNATSKLISYYKAVKDTANFLRTASYFYDRYYLNISKDSADRRKIEDSKKINTSGIKGKMFFSYSNLPQPVAYELNNAAAYVIQTGTKNPFYISKALAWSKRALELQDVYGFYDTYAHLLYLSGYYKESEYNQQIAIDMAKKKKLPYEFLEKQLLKIKERTL